MPCYLPIACGRIVGFILFPRVSTLCEMQTGLLRIWTWVTISVFYDGNHYTICEHFSRNQWCLALCENVWVLYIGGGVFVLSCSHGEVNRSCSHNNQHDQIYTQLFCVFKLLNVDFNKVLIKITLFLLNANSLGDLPTPRFLFCFLCSC